jgi:hypothetical protein
VLGDEMIVLINGSFGVGKSTVASILRRRLSGSRLYNPELAGSILMRTPSFVRLRGSGTDDFQNIDLWRKSVVRGTGLARTISGGTVIVPMALKRRDYFDEIVGGFREIDPQIKVFCLIATMPTIEARLTHRRVSLQERNWSVRKAHECINAHVQPGFGEPIDTEGSSAMEVVDEILRRLKNTEVPAVQ